MSTMHTNHHSDRDPHRDSHRDAMWGGLPDPHYQAEFYADVTLKRALAWLVDTVVVFALTFLAVVFTVGIGLFFAAFLFMIIGFTYRVVTITNSGGATLGMRLAAIELRTHRGTRPDLGTAVLHTLGYSISFSMVFVQVASIILMLTTPPRGQGLHDMVLGTAMVNRMGGR